MKSNLPEQRFPQWPKKSVRDSEAVHLMKSTLRRHALHTVCEEARCPNISECFARQTATIMILGKICTRRCGFCGVSHGRPFEPDAGEPRRVARQIKKLGLKHAVITSVTRDDLKDGGAGHFAKTIEEIKMASPGTTIEVLTPDFGGRVSSIKTVCLAAPDIFNHNIETVKRLTPKVRDKANYDRSLSVLSAARDYLKKGQTKSGLMVGLGESFDEVNETLSDLRAASCDIVTIGQYLRPSKNALTVKEYIEPELFQRYKYLALKKGFKFVFSGPFVRSSYLAEMAFSKRAETGGI